MLKINKLCKKYGKKSVLNGITLETECQVIGLLGPNGAGKTTWMKIIAGILKCTSGEILYKDHTGKDKTLDTVKIGYLPQNFGLIKNYTLYEHLEYFACVRGMKKEEWKEEITKILEMVHLEEQQNVKCGKLSGGMVRRAGIAQAFLGNPDIVLLDEPTTGLDPEERIRFLNLINYFGKKCMIIISTHILDDVARVCDELIVLDKGNLLYHGSAADLTSLATNRVSSMSEVDLHHENPKAQSMNAQIEDGYMYLIKKSRE